VEPGGFTQRIDISHSPRPAISIRNGRGGAHGYFWFDRGGQAPARGDRAGQRRGRRGRLGGGPDRQDQGMPHIGIAGGAVKVRRLITDYHFDVPLTIAASVAALTVEIAAAAPVGVDIVFENVGGGILDAALMNLGAKARIILCGLISEYNSPEKSGAAISGSS